VRLELELALRLVRRRAGLLRGTALAAFFGVALATAALVVTLALMAGYRQAIAVPLERGGAHLVAFAGRPLSLAEGRRRAAAVAVLPGVREAGPVTYLAALAEDPRDPAHPLPVTLKAVDRPPAFSDLAAWPESAEVPVVAGDRLASSLSLSTGDGVTLRLPPQAGSWLLPSLRTTLVGTFHLGFAELDDTWLIGPLAAILARLPGSGVTAVEVRLDDPLAVDAVRPAVEAALPSMVVTDWRDMNRALFAALRWQTLSLFLVLTLVVAVASFQVSSAMVVLAISKRRATGTLQAVGMTPARVRRVLVFAGTMLGGSGVVAGLVFGFVVSEVMTRFRLLRFPVDLARVYMVDHIPSVRGAAAPARRRGGDRLHPGVARIGVAGVAGVPARAHRGPAGGVRAEPPGHGGTVGHRGRSGRGHHLEVQGENGGVAASCVPTSASRRAGSSLRALLCSVPPRCVGRVPEWVTPGGDPG